MIRPCREISEEVPELATGKASWLRQGKDERRKAWHSQLGMRTTKEMSGLAAHFPTLYLAILLHNPAAKQLELLLTAQLTWLLLSTVGVRT